MYFLDTNTCIAITNASQPVLEAFGTKRNDCALPIIVVSELYKGAYCSKRVKRNLDTVDELLQMLPVIEFDLNAAEDFGRIQAELRRIGRPTGAMDALIAAIARSNAATLVTHNTKDFQRIPDLKLEDWLT
ncbi:MAG: PIN domain-containing protein [Cyanobacteria bacterium J06581_3]